MNISNLANTSKSGALCTGIKKAGLKSGPKCDFMALIGELVNNAGNNSEAVNNPISILNGISDPGNVLNTADENAGYTYTGLPADNSGTSGKNDKKPAESADLNTLAMLFQALPQQTPFPTADALTKLQNLKIDVDGAAKTTGTSYVDLNLSLNNSNNSETVLKKNSTDINLQQQNSRPYNTNAAIYGQSNSQDTAESLKNSSFTFDIALNNNVQTSEITASKVLQNHRITDVKNSGAISNVQQTSQSFPDKTGVQSNQNNSSQTPKFSYKPESQFSDGTQSAPVSGNKAVAVKSMAAGLLTVNKAQEEKQVSAADNADKKKIVPKQKAAQVSAVKKAVGSGSVKGGKNKSSTDSGSNDDDKTVLNNAASHEVSFTTAAEKVRMDKTSVIKQAAEAAEEAVKNGTNEIKFNLSPESLGDITVKMVSKNGALSIRITAENSATGQLLAGNVNDLKDAISQHGITTAKTEVVFSGGGNPGFNTGGFSQNRQQYNSSKDYSMPELIFQKERTETSTESTAKSGMLSVVA